MPNTREKLIELLGGVQSYGVKHTYEETASFMGFRENDEVANHLIANGVTIPVRCNDCKHWEAVGGLEPHMECNIFYGIHEYGYATNADDFCSYGERRNDG